MTAPDPARTKPVWIDEIPAFRAVDQHSGDVAAQPEFTHGASAYTNRGCRCEVCRVAHREDCRKRRGYQPSRLVLDNDMLRRQNEGLLETVTELAEKNDALCDENAELHIRVQELTTERNDLLAAVSARTP